MEADKTKLRVLRLQLSTIAVNFKYCCLWNERTNLHTKGYEAFPTLKGVFVQFLLPAQHLTRYSSRRTLTKMQINCF